MNGSYPENGTHPVCRVRHVLITRVIGGVAISYAPRVFVMNTMASRMRERRRGTIWGEVTTGVPASRSPDACRANGETDVTARAIARGVVMRASHPIRRAAIVAAALAVLATAAPASAATWYSGQRNYAGASVEPAVDMATGSEVFLLTPIHAKTMANPRAHAPLYLVMYPGTIDGPGVQPELHADEL